MTTRARGGLGRNSGPPASSYDMGWMDTGCRVSQGKVRNEIAFDQTTLSDLWLAKKRGYKTARVDQDLQIN